MSKIRISAAIIMFAVPAFAQRMPDQPRPQEPPPAIDPTPELSILQADFGRVMQDINAVLVERQKQIDALHKQVDVLKQHQADMDAYLKLCGDTAGCTQAIEPPSAPPK